jgi:hypothetical protein
MNRRRKQGPPKPIAPGADPEFEIQWAIEMIGLIRTIIRKGGLIESADALDDAFVKCLREYVVRRPEIVGQASRKKRSRKKLN